MRNSLGHPQSFKISEVRNVRDLAQASFENNLTVVLFDPKDLSPPWDRFACHLWRPLRVRAADSLLAHAKQAIEIEDATAGVLTECRLNAGSQALLDGPDRSDSPAPQGRGKPRQHVPRIEVGEVKSRLRACRVGSPGSLCFHPGKQLLSVSAETKTIDPELPSSDGQWWVLVPAGCTTR
jgi:hypothetical protein